MGIQGDSSAAEQFAGYLCLDVLVGNQDRHHENWGAIRKQKGIALAPTFDHSASLARNLKEQEKQDRLNTTDVGYSV